MNRTLVVIPTYNEHGTIGALLRQIKALPVRVEILVVDDHSPDMTAEEVRACQQADKDLHLIVRDRKKGLGSAYREGFKYAVDRGYDSVIQMDGDGSHDPSHIPYFIEQMDRWDVVIGSRYVKDGRISQWSFSRAFLSRTANYFIRFLLRVPLNDFTSGYRCMKKDVLERIRIQRSTAQGYFFQIELTYRAFQSNAKIMEAPICFNGRVHDRSKMSFAIVWEAFFRVVGLAFSRGKRYPV